MELSGNWINYKMPGNLNSLDMKPEEPQTWKHSCYLLPLHHTCYLLAMSAVWESNIFKYIPFSISLPPHPNLLPTMPCATLFLVSMISLTSLPYIDLAISRLISTIPLFIPKCRKAKKLLNPHFKITNGRKSHALKLIKYKMNDTLEEAIECYS